MFGLGGKKAQIDVRTMLGEAAEDFGGANLRERVLFFFDNRKDFETWPDHSTGEPLWISDGYEPSNAEVAADVLREVLLEDRRAAVIDWADGAEQVLDVFDRLFERAGKPAIDLDRRRILSDLCEPLKRGEPVGKLMTPMDEEAQRRGLAVYWWNTESDAHIPQLLTSEARRKWRGAEFGKKFQVLP